jgi:hypothetical protein
VDGVTPYLYEDLDLVAEEEKTLYRLLEEGVIDRETLNKRLKRAGRILIVSSPSGRTPGGLRPLQVQKPGRRT